MTQQQTRGQSSKIQKNDKSQQKKSHFWWQASKLTKFPWESLWEKMHPRPNASVLTFSNQICQPCISKMQKMLRICLLNIFLSSHSYIDAIGLWVWAKPFSCNLVPQNQSTILNTEGHFWEDVQYNSRLCNNGKFYRQHFLSILEKKTPCMFFITNILSQCKIYMLHTSTVFWHTLKAADTSA